MDTAWELKRGLRMFQGSGKLLWAIRLILSPRTFCMRPLETSFLSVCFHPLSFVETGVGVNSAEVIHRLRQFLFIFNAFGSRTLLLVNIAI